ncbi:MAG: right-handed parallel beta-helix repeat-containing protein [Armatimonadia bacterium]
MRRGVVLVAWAVIMASVGEGASYYVSPAGDDDNQGTSLNGAWRTIGHSVRRVGPGDVVLIADGVYREMVRFDGIARGERAVTYKAINSRRVVIDGEGGTYCVGTDWDRMWNLTLEGLKLQNAAIGIGFQTGGEGLTFRDCEVSACQEALRVKDGSELRIFDCYVHDNGNGILIGQKDVSGVKGVLIERTTCGRSAGSGRTGNTDGIAIEGLSRGVVVRDCVSYGAGDSGFDLKPGRTVIERCQAYDNSGWGLKLWGSGCWVINCLVYANDGGGIGCAGERLQFWNCTLGANGSEGLRLETRNVRGCVIRNSIFYDALVKCEAARLPDEDYNCYYSTRGEGAIIARDSAYGGAELGGRTPGTGRNSIARNPLFVRPGVDFHLSSASPCIGKGIYSELIELDLYRKPRQKPPDMGAIAFGGG